MCVNLNLVTENLLGYFTLQICLWIAGWRNRRMDKYSTSSGHEGNLEKFQGPRLKGF